MVPNWSAGGLFFQTNAWRPSASIIIIIIITVLSWKLMNRTCKTTWAFLIIFYWKTTANSCSNAHFNNETSGTKIRLTAASQRLTKNTLQLGPYFYKQWKWKIFQLNAVTWAYFVPQIANQTKIKRWLYQKCGNIRLLLWLINLIAIAIDVIIYIRAGTSGQCRTWNLVNGVIVLFINFRLHKLNNLSR